MLHKHFVQNARKFGRKTAFVDRARDTRISYSRALIASLILADKCKGFPGGFVGVMIPTSAGCALSVLGILMSGRTPVMINYSTGAETNARYAQQKCDFHTIVTSRALLEKIGCPKIDGMVFIEDIMANTSKTDKLKAAIVSKLPLPLLMRTICDGDLDDNAVILFTSGSEKEPKAVQLTHRNIIANIESFSAVGKIEASDSMLACLPFFHVFGLTVNLWTPLYHGMTIVTYPNPLDYRTICTIAREERPTLLMGTPSFLSGYLRRSEPGDFDSLRYVVTGADKCPDALREGFQKRHGITLYEGYGTTETSPVITVNAPGHNRPGSVGKPIPGVRVRIECYEAGGDCAPDQTGRILVSGDLVMKGYFDDFEETSMRVRQGWYDTGDMGYFDTDGYLWHAGRLKRFVKVAGEMVSLVRVEAVLESLLPDTVECCVVEVPDALKGARIAAAVTERIDETGILKRMSEALPNIALPKHFVVLDELPKMGSGKIDFRGVANIVVTRLHQKSDAKESPPPGTA